MESAGTTTYALLSLLAVRPWTGYELTKQARRSLHFVWPSSEAHLYREQRRLVDLGWATIRKEKAGGRTRNSYTITRSGRAALRRWMHTEPSPPTVEMEGALRAFFAEHGTVEDLRRSLDATAAGARATLDDLTGFAREYLASGSEFSARLHLIALAMEMLTGTFAEIERACLAASDEAAGWDTTVGQPGEMSQATRRRFERIVRRHAVRQRRP